MGSLLTKCILLTVDSLLTVDVLLTVRNSADRKAFLMVSVMMRKLIKKEGVQG